MRRNATIWLAGLGVVAVLHAPASSRGDDGPTGVRLFETRIRPVFVEYCYDCHSARAARLEANLRLDTREGLRRGGDSGPILEPGKPDDSLLVRALEYASENARMPPRGRLPDAVIADFRKWIAEGAPDPR